MDLSKDVNVETLPVVPQFLKQNENGGVRYEVIKIEESMMANKPSTQGSCTKS